MDAPHQADGVILETQCVQDVAARLKLPIVVLVDLGVGKYQEPLTLTLSRRERGLKAKAGQCSAVTQGL
ncbi:hypothetical protein CJU81_07500 [Pseudomonas fragi]|uniref:Uncharacterized protein n=1 Tax=Pseudomonas fragi TaxID=296 RepID=A0A267ALD0_PSEFR|nr:hypothetical protein CJU81_07500 [Pseudomonas fragi]